MPTSPDALARYVLEVPSSFTQYHMILQDSEVPSRTAHGTTLNTPHTNGPHTMATCWHDTFIATARGGALAATGQHERIRHDAAADPLTQVSTANIRISVSKVGSPLSSKQNNRRPGGQAAS